MSTRMNQTMSQNSKMNNHQEMKEVAMVRGEPEAPVVEVVTEEAIEVAVVVITVIEVVDSMTTEELKGLRVEVEDKITMKVTTNSKKNLGKSKANNGKTKKRECILINNSKKYWVKMKSGQNFLNETLNN